MTAKHQRHGASRHGFTLPHVLRSPEQRMLLFQLKSTALQVQFKCIVFTTSEHLQGSMFKLLPSPGPNRMTLLQCEDCS